MFKETAAVLLVALVGWMYKAIQPPPPRLCGSPGGPPITSPRIKLKDGRHLAYNERGVPKEKAKHKIIFAHGAAISKEMAFDASQELIEELGVYLLFYDRAGYGDSDPNPKRSVKSAAFDIQELADQLELGERFYVVGISMAGYVAWSCIKYIPHRLAGVVLLGPVVNYWWPSLPKDLSSKVYRSLLFQDQWAIGIAHYAPQLLYWWGTQKWFPRFSNMDGNPKAFCPKDMEVRMTTNTESAIIELKAKQKAKQQGVFESTIRDTMIGFSTWEFDPLDLSNPFPHNDASHVHIWHGDEDRTVSVHLQRYVSERLPWIKYHELPGYGHLLPRSNSVCNEMLKALVVQDYSPSLELND